MNEYLAPAGKEKCHQRFILRRKLKNFQKGELSTLKMSSVVRAGRCLESQKCLSVEMDQVARLLETPEIKVEKRLNNTVVTTEADCVDPPWST